MNTPLTVAHVFDEDGSAPNGIDFPGGTSQLVKPNTGETARKLMHVCPSCKGWAGIRVGHPKPEPSPSWDITGGSLDDLTSLTLRPSILCSCGWHGYLTNGVFHE